MFVKCKNLGLKWKMKNAFTSSYCVFFNSFVCIYVFVTPMDMNKRAPFYFCNRFQFECKQK